MMRDYTASAKTLSLGHIHKVKYLVSVHANALHRNVTGWLSSEFMPAQSRAKFYGIDSNDDSLLRMLSMGSYHYFDYEFDKILSSVLHNLFVAKKTYIEFAIDKDDTGTIKKVSIIPFDAIKLVSFRGTSLFLGKGFNNKLKLFTLSKRRYIQLESKAVFKGKRYIKKLTRKLKRMDKDRATEYLSDIKMKQIYRYDLWSRKRDYLILKYPQKIGWYGINPSNPLLSESELLYRSIKFKQFRKNALEYLLQNINNGLKQISDEIETTGRIVVTKPFIEYEKEWQRYIAGEICASELSDIILPI